MGMVLACYSNPSNYNKTMSIEGAAVFVGDTGGCWNLTSLCSLSWPWGVQGRTEVRGCLWVAVFQGDAVRWDPGFYHFP